MAADDSVLLASALEKVVVRGGAEGVRVVFALNFQLFEWNLKNVSAFYLFQIWSVLSPSDFPYCPASLVLFDCFFAADYSLSLMQRRHVTVCPIACIPVRRYPSWFSPSRTCWRITATLN